MVAFRKYRIIWLNENIRFSRTYDGDHQPLGSEAWAGGHRRLRFANQTSTPSAVQNYFQMYGTSPTLEIQTGATTPALQSIYPCTYSPAIFANYNFTGSDGKIAFRVLIACQQIIGTPLYTINMRLSPTLQYNSIVAQAFNIPYYNNDVPMQLTSILSATSCTMPTATDNGAPIWGMAQFNSNFSGTASLATVGAYLSSVVVYVDNQKMVQSAYAGKGWTLTIIGAI